jgi:hypothetical protein
MEMKMSFLWIPGQGPDLAIIEDMCLRLPMPAEPMGEAWFMGNERKMFDELLDPNNFDEVEHCWELRMRHSRALSEIASGRRFFGEFSEWRDWLHYLLPRVARAYANIQPAILEDPLELIVEAVVLHYPHDFTWAPYPGFREHILATLGRALMHGSRWSGGRVRPCMLLPHTCEQCRFEEWYEPSHYLGAALFLHLKYLTPSELVPWTQSLLRIEDPHWRAQLMRWMTLARTTLLASAHGNTPSDAPEDRVWGADSRSDEGAYEVPHANALAFTATAADYFKKVSPVDWWVSMADYPYLDLSTWDIIERFESHYAPSSRSP